MHVVILADFAVPSGGAQRVAIESARALAEVGVQVTYVHAIGTEGDRQLDHPSIQRIGLGYPDVWEASRLKGLVTGLWNGAAARRVSRILADLPAGGTVVHVHQWTRALSPAVLPACIDSGHPVAVTLHDYFLACPNGVYYRFERNTPCDVRPLSAACLTAPCDPRNSLFKAVRTWRTALTNYTLQRKRFDVIHVSDRGRDTVAPLLPFAVRHHRVDNPVAVDKGPPAALAPGGAFAYLGRLTREKGADLAAAAAREAGVPAVFVGEGPLADEIARLNPEARVLGWRSSEDVAALMRREVRAVVAPSRWYETGPLTVYEALAAGVPAVASTRSGASEKVDDGVTGYVVEPEVGAFAAAFRTLADDGVARALGAAAYERYWAAPPTPARHAERLVKIYGDMLAVPA